MQAVLLPTFGIPGIRHSGRGCIRAIRHSDPEPFSSTLKLGIISWAPAKCGPADGRTCNLRTENLRTANVDQWVNCGPLICGSHSTNDGKDDGERRQKRCHTITDGGGAATAIRTCRDSVEVMPETS